MTSNFKATIDEYMSNDSASRLLLQIQHAFDRFVNEIKQDLPEDEVLVEKIDHIRSEVDAAIRTAKTYGHVAQLGRRRNAQNVDSVGPNPTVATLK